MSSCLRRHIHARYSILLANIVYLALAITIVLSSVYSMHVQVWLKAIATIPGLSIRFFGNVMKFQKSSRGSSYSCSIFEPDLSQMFIRSHIRFVYWLGAMYHKQMVRTMIKNNRGGLTSPIFKYDGAMKLKFNNIII